MTKDRERMRRQDDPFGAWLDADHQPAADPGGNRAQRRLAARMKRRKKTREAAK